MTLPNFLLIGAAKSGTSSLYSQLWQHPQVFMSANKEPNFFAFEGRKVAYAGPGDETVNRKSVTERGAYEALFSNVENETAVGEASVLYLYHPEAAGRIRRAIPQARLIAILRNPADRAYSSYLHTRRDGREPLEHFADALAEEPKRIAANWGHLWHYRQLGYYYDQLCRYLDLFPREQLAVYTYDEYRQEPVKVVQALFAFLGVDPSFRPDMSVAYNVSGRARSPKLQKWLVQSNRTKDALKQLLPAQTRQRLVQRLMRLNVDSSGSDMSATDRQYLLGCYRADILKLQDLIDRDLSHWLAE